MANVSALRPFEFRFRVNHPIDDELERIMRRQGDHMTVFRNLVLDQDRMGGRVTFAFNPHEVDDSHTQLVCKDWVEGTRRQLRRASMRALVKGEDRSESLTAASSSVLPYFESNQFHVIKDFISTENLNDRPDPTFAKSIDEYIDFVRNRIESGEDPETALELADDVALPLTERHADFVTRLGSVAATAAEIAVLTSTLREQVAAARRAGASWRQIARAAGVDVAVAHRRWKKDAD